MLVDIYEEDMSRSMWSNGDKDYFFCIEDDGEMRVFAGQKAILAGKYINDGGLSSWGYNGRLYCTLDDENIIYRMNDDAWKAEEAAVLEMYDSVEILKCINHTDNLMVLKTRKDRHTDYLVYDIIKGKILFKLPIGSGFVDLALLDSHTGLLLCEDEWDISRYEDDDDYEHVFWIHFSYENDGEEAKIIGAARLYASFDNFDDHWMERRQYDNGMKFPLFDRYLYYYPESKSISSGGKYIVYYCQDIKGIIISNFTNGDVYRIVSLTEESKNAYYYFNDTANILTVVNDTSQMEPVTHYSIQATSEEALLKLNEAYNAYYAARKHAKNNFEFESLLHRAIDSCKCEKI